MRMYVVFTILITACGSKAPNKDSRPVTYDVFPSFKWDSWDLNLTVLDQTPTKPDAFVQIDQGSQPDQGMPKPDTFIQPDQGMPDQGMPDQGMPDQGMPDQGMPDQGMPDSFVFPCLHPKVKKNCIDGWCMIPAGCFKMIAQGSGMPPCSNKKWREVRINHSFVISQHETTEGEHHDRTSQHCYGSDWKGSTTPAIHVPVGSAEYYCNRLSIYENREQCYTCTAGYPACSGTVCAPIKDPHKCKGYRLPTEAEWEYAYRAGTQTDYYNGNMTTCNSKFDPKAFQIAYYGQGGGLVWPQKKCFKAENGWGLCDMSGNQQEWTYDNYVPSQGTTTIINPVGPTSMRGMRGGYYRSKASYVLGASRNVVDPKGYGAVQHGYRCVRSL